MGVNGSKWIEKSEEMFHLFILDCIMVCTINQFRMPGCTSWVVLDQETCLDDRQQLRISSLQCCGSVIYRVRESVG